MQSSFEVSDYPLCCCIICMLCFLVMLNDEHIIKIFNISCAACEWWGRRRRRASGLHGLCYALHHSPIQGDADGVVDKSVSLTYS
jgi:hypothetical protein